MIAKGFSVSGRQDVEINGPMVLDAQLIIQADTQVLNVDDEANSVAADPTSNGSALVLREKELAALSDDPDELQQQLQAMAGPGAGPNGGQIYIDGFTGGNLPNKSSIREVRINSNPFSPEYERPGFGRIEILTKPGTDTLHGQAFGQYNKEALNSRSPLLTSPKRPQYRQDIFGFNLTGPIKKDKACFGLDAQRRSTQENAFIIATTLDSNFAPLSVNQSVLTPQSSMGISPRLDYAINGSNTLVARYQYNRQSFDKQGIGDFNLASKAFDQRNTENTLQVTETAILSPRFINETRFHFMRTQFAEHGRQYRFPRSTCRARSTAAARRSAIRAHLSDRLELSNNSTYTHKTHTIKWGGRLRQGYLDSTSVSNFGGTYSFLGGSGPVLDANNQPAGRHVDAAHGAGALPAHADFPAGRDERRADPPAGRRRFAIQPERGHAAHVGEASSTPGCSERRLAGASEPDLQLRPAVRNAEQHQRPWRIFRRASRWRGESTPRAAQPAKTVLRAGFGIFFDRVNENVTLNELRFNGVTQQSYFIIDPSFYPAIPTLAALAAGRQPQSLQYVDSGLKAPHTYQTSIGVDRQITKSVKISAAYLNGRGTHLSRSRDINAPIGGLFPYGDSQMRYLTESTGFSRTNQIQVTPSVNYKKLFVFGFYALSYGRTDAEGQAADPYNLRQEWGPSSFGDVRHRMVVGTSLPLPWKISVSPFIMASSGAPYNITTGRDTNGDSITTERPSIVALGAGQCTGRDLYYAASFGCFNLNPAPGTSISRNYGRGPGSFNMSVRAARTWTIGGKGEAPGGMGGMMMGGPGGGGPGGGPAVAACAAAADRLRAAVAA